MKNRFFVPEDSEYSRARFYPFWCYLSSQGVSSKVNIQGRDERRAPRRRGYSESSYWPFKASPPGRRAGLHSGPCLPAGDWEMNTESENSPGVFQCLVILKRQRGAVPWIRCRAGPRESIATGEVHPAGPEPPAVCRLNVQRDSDRVTSHWQIEGHSFKLNQMGLRRPRHRST